MLFYVVTAIILSFYFLYPRSKWEAAVILYVSLIPFGTMLSSGDQLLGFIDHRSVAAAIVIFSAYTLSPTPITIKRSHLDILKKVAIVLALVGVIFINRYIQIKNGIIIYDAVDFGLQFKRIVRDSIDVFAMILIIYRMYDIKTLRGLERGVFIGTAIAISSMLFYDYFINIGFVMQGSDDFGTAPSRLTGFFGGDPNETSILFCVIAGYVLAKNEYANKIIKLDIILWSMCLIGVLFCASRTGFVAFVFLNIMYIFKIAKNLKKTVVYSSVFLIMSLIMFNLLGGVMIERIHTYQTGEFDTLASRQSYWVMYSNDILNNPDYLIFGNTDLPTYHRSVHNGYIHYLFHGGMFPFGIIMIVFWKTYKCRNKYKFNYLYYTPIYILFAHLVGWITVVYTIKHWFILLIAASAGVPDEYFNKKNKVHLGNA